MRRIISLSKFLGVGLPAFLLAVPMNIWLVERAGWPKPLAYFFVLLLQVSFNYLMCKVFVFRAEGARASLPEYVKFMSGIMLFRALDWGLYVLVVEAFGVYYLVAQISNVIVFSIGKFFFAERLLKRAGAAAGEESGLARDRAGTPAVQTGTPAMEGPRTGWRLPAALWTILALALLFRSFGLSHDLDLGKGYHPDTPKQVRMAERYARGIFYHEVGARDYDGYPYFNSLLAAGVYRVALAVGDWAQGHLGLHTSRPTPPVIMLEWIMRLMNVALSTLGVWVVYLLGRRLGGVRVGLWSALAMALSPLDIAACHYASGDSAAGLFVALSLYFSVRIHQEGRLWDYVLAAAACMCAFAAKYHGAMVASGLIVAHALRARTVRELFGAASWRRVGLVLLTVAVVFFLTNPGTLVRTSRGIARIVEFLQFSTQFGQRDEAIRLMTPLARWVNSIRLNIPVFIDFLSPVFLAFALVGVLWAFAGRKAWLTLAWLPILYMGLGLSAKTAGNAVYSTIVTPPLFVLAVLTIDEVMRFRICPPVPRVMGWSALLVGALLLGNSAYREMFFFWNNDTRVLAERWVRENVPLGYAVTGGRYTALDGDLADRPGRLMDEGAGSVYVQADPRDRAPAGAFRMNRFRLEDRPLPLFRNWPVNIFLAGGVGDIRSDWRLPTCQQIPSAFDTDLIFAGGRDFWRSPRVFGVGAGGTACKSLLSLELLEDVLLVVTAGHVPTRVKVSVGGVADSWFMESGRVEWKFFGGLRRRLPLLERLQVYRVSVESGHGPVQVEVATTPAEKGLALFHAGAFREALPWLDRAVELEPDPTLTACRQIAFSILAPDDKPGAKRRFSTLAAFVNRPLSASDLPGLYGVSESYLRELAYIDWRPEDLGLAGFRPADVEVVAGESAGGGAASNSRDPAELEESSNAVRRVESPLVMLPGGCYTVQLRCAPGAPLEGAAEIVFSLCDAADRPVCPTARVTLPATRFGTVENLSVALQKPGQPASVRVRVEMPHTLNLVVHGLSIRPDPVAGVQAIRNALGALVYGESPRAAATPANYELLMALARSVEAGDRSARSRPYYLLAAQACPNRTEPIEALIRTSLHIHEDAPTDVVRRVAGYAATAAQRRMRPADVRFEGGIRLTGFSLDGDRVRAGGSLGVKLDWDVSGADSRRGRSAVWMHFVDRRGESVFQGDHGLLKDLAAPRHVRTLSTEDHVNVPVPESTPPGKYALRVGLWIPSERQRLAGRSDTAPMVKRGAELAVIEVVR